MVEAGPIEAGGAAPFPRRARSGRRWSWVLCLLLAGCGGGDPTATDPLKVFADGFVSDPGSVHIEAEGGTIIGGYDAWLMLRPAGRLTPRFDQAYEPIPCDEPAAFFSRLPPGAGLDASASSLSCRAYTDPRLTIPNGRWILEDPRAGRTWFRAWKGKPL